MRFSTRGRWPAWTVATGALVVAIGGTALAGPGGPPSVAAKARSCRGAHCHKPPKPAPLTAAAAKTLADREIARLAPTLYVGGSDYASTANIANRAALVDQASTALHAASADTASAATTADSARTAGSAGISSVQYVSARKAFTTAANVGDQLVVTAQCPSGSTAISGGFQLDPPAAGNPSAVSVLESRASATSGWTVDAVVDQTLTVATNVTATAICAPVAATTGSG